MTRREDDDAGIFILVLAAGRSRRMNGGPKLLLPFGESTILETVLRTALASRAGEILVVLGGWRDEIEPIARKYPVRLVFNPDPDRGMLSSIQVGLAAIPGGRGAVFVVPGDQPGIREDIFERLLNARAATGAGLVLPAHGDKGGHPLLVDLRYRNEIARLDSQEGLRQLLLLHPEDVRRMAVEDAGVVLDIDTLEDYRMAKK